MTTVTRPADNSIRMNAATRTGSALVVTLLLLVVLTTLGIAGMGVTVLQQRMANNLQDNTQVFEAAESALRLCEKHVIAGDSDAGGRTDTGELADFSAGSPFTPARAELLRPRPAEPLAAAGATEYRLRCLIEFTGPVDASRIGGSVRRPATVDDFAGYRITAAGVRVPAEAVDTARPTVILQSDVVTRN